VWNGIENEKKREELKAEIFTTTTRTKIEKKFLFNNNNKIYL
jgi:hypothetical protein